jgi:hypothetical protein
MPDEALPVTGDYRNKLSGKVWRYEILPDGRARTAVISNLGQRKTRFISQEHLLKHFERVDDDQHGPTPVPDPPGDSRTGAVDTDSDGVARRADAKSEEHPCTGDRPAGMGHVHRSTNNTGIRPY